MMGTMAKALRLLGYGQPTRSQRRRMRPYPKDYDAEAIEIIERVKDYTMVRHERLHALIEAVRYVQRHGVPGAIVECGVWRGGAVMAAMLALRDAGGPDRDVYLYDTFEGMPRPEERDRKILGTPSLPRFEELQDGEDRSDWCRAGLDEVRANLATLDYDAARLHLVQGKVEETIPGTLPEAIAVLRLDTDWYASTRHEMEHLFPRLSQGGVLLVDDYGTWTGAREAIDEYLKTHGIRMLLTRVDRSVVGVKQ